MDASHSSSDGRDAKSFASHRFSARHGVTWLYLYVTVVAALRTRLPLIITVVVAVRTWLLASLENDFE